MNFLISHSINVRKTHSFSLKSYLISIYRHILIPFCIIHFCSIEYNGDISYFYAATGLAFVHDGSISNYRLFIRVLKE